MLIEVINSVNILLKLLYFIRLGSYICVYKTIITSDTRNIHFFYPKY